MLVAAGVASHLWNALRRAFARIALWSGLTGLITVILTELAGIFTTGELPGLPTHLAALALGLAVGYAAGMTVLTGEVLRSLVEIVRDATVDVEQGLQRGSKLGGVLAQGLEQFERHL